MRHTNPNMVAPVLQGIQDGEALAGHTSGDDVLFLQYKHLDDLTEELGRPTGQFLVAAQVAWTQGFIAAYRSAEDW